MTEEEKRLVAEGRKPMDVFVGRHLGKQGSTREYAGQLLAEELRQASQSRFVRENRRSRLEEIRQPTDLQQARFFTTSCVQVVAKMTSLAVLMPCTAARNALRVLG